MRTRIALGLTIAALATVPLSAHDFWLAALNWTPVPGTPVTITAGVGEKFPTRTNLRARANWLAQWRVIGATGDVRVTKEFRRDNLVEATDVTLPSPGAYLGVAIVSAQVIEMKAQEFTDYLKEEGLDSVIAARQAAGEADKPAKEKYARYAKVAIRSGAGSGAHLTRPAGLAAEFIPATDPTSVRPGGSLTVQLIADGKPVAGAEISAVNDEKLVRAMTDSQGRATFTIDRPAAWLIKTVHMVRLPQTGTPEADWESFWVTLAFHTAK
jgi:uncharacterized GH25 family protein